MKSQYNNNTVYKKIQYNNNNTQCDECEDSTLPDQRSIIVAIGKSKIYNNCYNC